MESLKAVPTEYRGTRYRSKSEAMFALNLDVCRSSFPRTHHCISQWWEAIWVYEPNFEWLNGFSCDFLLSWILFDNERLVINQRLVEYKPSKPTKTFCDNYFSKFFKHCASTESEPSVERQALIIYGSVYREDRGIVRCCKEGDGIEFLDLNWIFDDSKLLSYRFDLEGGSL